MSRSQHNSRHYRQPDSYNRRSPQREPQKRILIICEGETEEIYFRFLAQEYKLQTAVVIKCAEGGSAEEIVHFGISERKRLKKLDQLSEADQLWCVLDLDIGDHSKKVSFDKAVIRAKQEKRELAVSNPCIEYWFILHYEKTTISLSDYNQAEKKLKQSVQNYEKNQATLKLLLPEKFLPHTEVALKHAKDCSKSMGETNAEEYPNPSTTIPKLIEELNKLKNNKPYR